MPHPFDLPTRLPRDLARAHAYWKSLLRGAADMPFADDLKLSDLAGLEDRLFLVDVFERPERFRMNTVAAALGAPDLAGRFLDEVELEGAFEFLRTQAVATLEAAAPTFFATSGEDGCLRLLLPMWGEGRIGLLLGAVDFD